MSCLLIVKPKPTFSLVVQCLLWQGEIVLVQRHVHSHNPVYAQLLLLSIPHCSLLQRTILGHVVRVNARRLSKARMLQASITDIVDNSVPSLPLMLADRTFQGHHVFAACSLCEHTWPYRLLQSDAMRRCTPRRSFAGYHGAHRLCGHAVDEKVIFP